MWGLEEIFAHYVCSNITDHIQEDMQTQCPSSDEQINKVWYIYTLGYYSALKGKNIHHTLQDEPRGFYG